MAVRPVQLISLVVPAGLLLASTLKLIAFFHQRNDIWWTPPSMAAPLSVSGDRAEISARGTDLRALLDAGRVRVSLESGPVVLTAEDVRVRFNNWDRVRAEQIPMLLVYAGTVGFTLCLIVAIGGLSLRRGERSFSAP